MKHFISVVAVVSLIQPLQAQILFTYDFAGPDPGGDLAVPSVPDLALSPFARVNVTAVSQADVFSSSRWTMGSSLDPTEFVAFTMQPEAGHALNLTGLTWDTSRSSTGPQSGRVELFENGVSLGASSDFVIGTSMENRMFDFGDATASPSDILELRFYGWNASSTGNLRLDNVSGVGTITMLPEPRGCALAAGAGLLAFAIHRRAKRSRA